MTPWTPSFFTGQVRNGTAGQKRQWREWELELVHGQPEVFKAAAPVLASAGARPSGHESKLRRVLGRRRRKPQPLQNLQPLQNPPAVQNLQALPRLTAQGISRRAKQPGGRKPGKKWPASAVVSAYLDGQIREILANDARVRLEEPDAIHAMRSATRRMRSALAVYRKLYGEERWAGCATSSSGWAGSSARHVMLKSCWTGCGRTPRSSRRGSGRRVKQRIERELVTRLEAGYRKTQEVLLTDRYFRLLDDLEDFRDHPPVRPAAAAPARKAARKLVGKSAKRLRRAHKAALQDKDDAGEKRGMELKALRRTKPRCTRCGRTPNG